MGGEEITAVDDAAIDRRLLPLVRIGEDRPAHAVDHRAGKIGERRETFDRGPAEVDPIEHAIVVGGAKVVVDEPAGGRVVFDQMQILPRLVLLVATHLGDEEPAGGKVPARPEGVAESMGKEGIVIGPGAVHVGIIGRDAPVLVDADHAAARVREARRVGALKVIAHGQPEFAIRPEIKAAAKVAAGIVAMGVLPENHLGRRVGPAAQAPAVGTVREARNPRALAVRPAVGRVEQVNVRLRREPGIDGDIEQAPLLVGFDPVGMRRTGQVQVDFGSRWRRACIHNPDCTLLLNHQHAAVRQEPQRHRLLEIRHDILDGKFCRRRRDGGAGDDHGQQESEAEPSKGREADPSQGRRGAGRGKNHGLGLHQTGWNRSGASRRRTHALLFDGRECSRNFSPSGLAGGRFATGRKTRAGGMIGARQMRVFYARAPSILTAQSRHLNGGACARLRRRFSRPAPTRGWPQRLPRPPTRSIVPKPTDEPPGTTGRAGHDRSRVRPRRPPCPPRRRAGAGADHQ